MSDMKCSNCGAGFDTTVGGYCQYCGSFVRSNNSDTPSSGHYTAEQSPLAKLQAAYEAIKSAEQLLEYYCLAHYSGSNRKYTDYELEALQEFGTAGGVGACEHAISLFAEDIRSDSYSSEEVKLVMSKAYNYLGWLLFYGGGEEGDGLGDHESEGRNKEGLEAFEKAVRLNPSNLEMKEHLLEASERAVKPNYMKTIQLLMLAGSIVCFLLSFFIERQ